MGKLYDTYEPKTKKQKKVSVGKINLTEVRLNAANKLGAYMPEVRTGTGAHGSPTKDRKRMKQKDKQLFKDYM